MLFSRKRVLTLFILLATMSAASQAMAACDPSADGRVCRGDSCPADSLGTTTLDYDKQSVIACLKDGSGGYMWKAMNGLPDIDCSTIEGQAVIKIENGKAVCGYLFKGNFSCQCRHKGPCTAADSCIQPPRGGSPNPVTGNYSCPTGTTTVFVNTWKINPQCDTPSECGHAANYDCE